MNEDIYPRLDGCKLPWRKRNCRLFLLRLLRLFSLIFLGCDKRSSRDCRNGDIEVDVHAGSERSQSPEGHTISALYNDELLT